MIKIIRIYLLTLAWEHLQIEPQTLKTANKLNSIKKQLINLGAM